MANFTRIILRHDTAANWTRVNPVLSDGEIGVETDTLRIKVGDGANSWNQLQYSDTRITSTLIDPATGNLIITYSDGITQRSTNVGKVKGTSISQQIVDYGVSEDLTRPTDWQSTLPTVQPGSYL